jgi:hypothetical protein
MTVDELNILHEKAKTRKDGVYNFRGNLWVVKSNQFIAYADLFGRCFQRMGAFNAVIGEVQSYQRKEALLKWLKSQK